MDGLGSTRLGRASSRYGSTAVFSGPVRKWKKKWVHVSSPSAANQSHSESNGSGNGAALMLCRWTPLSYADSESAAAEEPPKRKFRYMPIAALEEGGRKNSSAKQVGMEAKTNDINESTDWLSSKNDILNMNCDLKKESQDSNMGHLDLDLRLKGHISDSQSGVQHNTNIPNSGGFWKLG